PDERIAEIEDFVDFIAARERDMALTRAAASTSAPAFSEVWDDPETTSTTRFEFGDVVLVPFPFTEQSASKKRPAVVVSGRDCCAARAVAVLMAITSQLRPSTAFGDLWLRDWEPAGLLKPSAVKPC